MGGVGDLAATADVARALARDSAGADAGILRLASHAARLPDAITPTLPEGLLDVHALASMARDQYAALTQARDGVRRVLIAVADKGNVTEAPLYLQQRIRALGHVADLVRTAETTVDAAGQVSVRGVALPHYDVVIARGGAENTEDGLATLAAIRDHAGIPVLNGPEAIHTAGSKWRTSQALDAAGVEHVESVLVTPGSTTAMRDQVRSAVDRFGDAPMVLKPASDLGGNGVTFLPPLKPALSDDLAEVSLRSLVDDRLGKNGSGVLVQRWFAEGTGRDTRAFVVKNAQGDYDIVGAYERVAPDGVGTANVSKGATAHPVQLDPALQDIARRAAAAVGLDNGAVDFIHTSEGWKVLEVNSSAGVRPGTEADAGGDVAGAVVAQALRIAGVG